MDSEINWVTVFPTLVSSVNEIVSDSEMLIFLFTEIRSAPVPIVTVEMIPPLSPAPPPSYAIATVSEPTLSSVPLVA